MMRLLDKGKSTSGKQGSESVFRLQLQRDGWTMDAGRMRRFPKKKDTEQSAAARGEKEAWGLMD